MWGFMITVIYPWKWTTALVTCSTTLWDWLHQYIISMSVFPEVNTVTMFLFIYIFYSFLDQAQTFIWDQNINHYLIRFKYVLTVSYSTEGPCTNWNICDIAGVQNCYWSMFKRARHLFIKKMYPPSDLACHLWAKAVWSQCRLCPGLAAPMLT